MKLSNSDDFLKVYKCIKPKFPQAITAVYESDERGEIRFTGKYKEDEQRPEEETGYLSTFVSDSGSPFWTETTDWIGRKRATIVALVQGAGKIGAQYDPTVFINDEYYQCRMIGTKLTKNIVDWVKKKSGIIGT